MLRYRMYGLDEYGRIRFGDEIEASSDEEAVERLRDMKPNAVTCELWIGRRLVATLAGPELAADLATA